MTWQVKPVGEVFRVVNGGTPKTGVTDYWGGPHQWITPAEMGGLTSPCLAASRRTLSDEGLRVGAELIPANSIILSSRAPIGHLVINAGPMAFNQGCKGLVPSKGIDTKFAYYFFLFNVPLLESLGTGATFRELSAGKLKDVPFCFPELAEQHRIVAILDEAFAGIATAKANVEKNLQNARDVLENSCQEYLSAAGGTRTTTLGEEIALLVGFAFKSSGYVAAGNGVRLLRGDNIVQGSTRWEGAKYWPANDVKGYARFQLREGDVVVAMDRPWVKAGLKRAILQAEDLPALLVQRTACLRVGPRIDHRYLFQVISANGFSRHLLDVQTGSGVPHISAEQIRDYRFALPPIAEQCRTVEKMAALQAKFRYLQSLYTRKLAALDELKQSLLQRAFSGEL